MEEAVATMGTALTEEQAKLLRRNVETVVLCYDGDKAGREATMKAGQLLLQVGCQVKLHPCQISLILMNMCNNMGQLLLKIL